MDLKRLLRNQDFTLALIGAFIAAILFPTIGTSDGPLKTGLTTKVAIALIFFMQGLSLPSRQIARSATKVKLHLFCQSSNFIVAPLLMLGMTSLFSSWIHPNIQVGFIFLSILPTTISSAIVLTSNSEGDSSAALFSTTLSNILGIFITPLLCSLLLNTASHSGIPIGTLIGKLCLLVLLPIIIGQALRPFIRDRIDAAKGGFKTLSNTFIIFIVFATFCESAESGIWQEIGLSPIVITLAISSLYLVLFSWIVWSTASFAASNPAERVAAFFCGSQKTLAAGVPMASILFAQQADSGVIVAGLVILPLMCYHSLQLFLGGVLAPRLARNH